MLTLPRPAVLVGSLLLLGFQPAVDQIEFRPADGVESSKTFTITGDFELGDFSMIVSGQDMSGMVPMEQASGQFSASFSVVDQYVKSVDGRLVEFARKFVESNMEWDAADESGSEENWMELDGETVVFKWNDETKAYERSYKDGEGDEEKLEDMGINPDYLDYRTLLPQRAVSAGDRWSVDAKAMGSALLFGLDFENLPGMDEDIDDPEAAAIFEELKPAFERMLESFKTDCEYVGTRDEDGVTVAVIKVRVQADGSIDMAQMIEDLALKQIPPEVQVEMSIDTAALNMDMTGEGELLWDPKRGLPHSFQLSGDVTLSFELDASVSAEGQEQTIEANVEMDGSLNWSMD